MSVDRETVQYSAKATGLFYYYGDHPDRDFVFGGRIHSTSDVGINGHTVDFPAYPVGNIHGGIVCLNGQYYIFDHRHTHRSSFCRQGVAEPIYFDENGMIAQVEATSCGLNQGLLAGEGVYPAYIACNLFYSPDVPKEEWRACVTQDVVDIDPEQAASCSFDEPVGYIHEISDGCIIGYKYFSFSKPILDLKLLVRGHADGMLKVKLAEQADQVVGVAEIHVRSDSWNQIHVPVSISCGTSALFLEYIGEGCFDMLEFEME